MILGLSSYYLPIFEDIFESYGLPRELTTLAIIESALNPMAVSKTNARGMWQFMRTTARQYGL
jgi:membrane-bound lytic murein transglycosylase D